MTQVMIWMENTDLSDLGIDKPYFEKGYIDFSKIDAFWEDICDDKKCTAVVINGKTITISWKIDDVLNELKYHKNEKRF